MAIKPGRPVAMGIIDGTPFIGLPGNPVASFVTFVHVVRPTVLALAGAAQPRLVPMPVRAAFTYKKKSRPPRVCPRHAAQGRERRLEAVKFPREGAGLLSSLVETDGLVELGEAIDQGGTRPDSWVSCLRQLGLNAPVMSVDDAKPLRHVRDMTTTKLDLTGLRCPLPALKTRKALKSLVAGRFP